MHFELTMAAKQETQITPLQQMVSSCVGALATSLLMTPLDVVKTRLQAQSQVELPCIGQTALPGGSRRQAQALVLDSGCPKCSYATCRTCPSLPHSTNNLINPCGAGILC